MLFYDIFFNDAALFFLNEISLIHFLIPAIFRYCLIRVKCFIILGSGRDSFVHSVFRAPQLTTGKMHLNLETIAQFVINQAQHSLPYQKAWFVARSFGYECATVCIVRGWRKYSVTRGNNPSKTFRSSDLIVRFNFF